MTDTKIDETTPVALDDLFDVENEIAVKFAWEAISDLDVVPVITLHDKNGDLINPEDFTFFNQPSSEAGVAVFRRSTSSEADFALNLSQAPSKAVTVRLSVFCFYGDTKKSSAWRYNIIKEALHPKLSVQFHLEDVLDAEELKYEDYPATRVTVAHDSPETVPASGKFSYPFLELASISKTKNGWKVQSLKGHGKSIDKAVEDLFNSQLGEDDE